MRSTDINPAFDLMHEGKSIRVCRGVLMQFGRDVATPQSTTGLIAGNSSKNWDTTPVGLPDSQMIWSDCYAVLAAWLAAPNTSRIRLGTRLRAMPAHGIAPVTAQLDREHHIKLRRGACSSASATGHTAMRVMGLDPGETQSVCRLSTCRAGASCTGEEVDYTLNGVTQPIKFLHQDLGFFSMSTTRSDLCRRKRNLSHLPAAGAYGDGRISAGGEPYSSVCPTTLRGSSAGAETAGP